MTRVAIYIRVSTEEQAMHGLSLDAQREALTNYANANGFRIVDYYADEGITARKKASNRKELQRLLADVQANKVDLILVTKLDRWFRNIKDYYTVQDILEKHKCNWKTIFEDYDTSTAAGRLHINIMLSVNQDECDRTSERIRAVFQHKLENKEILSGTIPLGYAKKNKHLVIDPATAVVVQEIYDHYEICNSVRKTQQYISGKYEYRSYDAIKNILCNSLYKGVHRGIKEYCPPIITDKQWARVQALLEDNKRYYRNKTIDAEYVFSGMLHCAECGNRLSGNKRLKYGKPYKQYRCNNAAKNDVCANRYNVPETIVEKYLLKNVKAELEKYKVSYTVIAGQKKAYDTAGQIAKLKKKQLKLKDLYLDDLIDKDAYRADYTELADQIKDLESVVQQAPDIKAINDFLRLDFDAIYGTLTDTEKRYIWQSVIDKIYVGNSRYNISIKFK